MSKQADNPTNATVKNPHGLGDPYDTSLRIVEKEVLIPKIMRERAKTEKCTDEVAAFTKCCADNNLLMAITCREQNAAMQNCQTRWYQDEEFKNECKEIYLKERSEYRLTGIPKKHRNNQSHGLSGEDKANTDLR